MEHLLLRGCHPDLPVSEVRTAWGTSYTINAAGAIAISTANFLFLIAHGLNDSINNKHVVKEKTKNPTSAGCQV
jgi:hypothetical protein